MWNALYVVKGRQAIFGAVNLWCSMNKIEVKINRMGEIPYICRVAILGVHAAP